MCVFFTFPSWSHLIIIACFKVGCCSQILIPFSKRFWRISLSQLRPSNCTTHSEKWGKEYWTLSPDFSLGKTRMKPVLSSHRNAEPIKTREFLNHKITLVHLISENGQCHLQQRKMRNCSHVTDYSNQNKIKRSVTICALGCKLFRGRTYSWTQLAFTSYPEARNLITLLILSQLL